MILHQYLECMVVNISIDVELWEQVKCWFKALTFWWSWMGRKDWEGVHHPEDSITAVEGWLLGRQSGLTACMPVTLCGISIVWENQCTKAHWYFTPSRANEKNRWAWATSRLRILHTAESPLLLEVLFSVNEHCIVMARAFLPVSNNSMNALTFHTTNAREVARGMEGGNGSGVNGNFFIELRKIGNIMCIWARRLLFIYEFLN